MASLWDIVPLVVKVDVRGVEVEVIGLPVKDFAELLTTYPTLRAILDGQWRAGTVSIEAKQLFIEVPEAVREIIARGLADDKGTTREVVLYKIASLTASDQLALLRGVLEATMPDGPGPFAAGVVSILGGSWGKPTAQVEEPVPEMMDSDGSAPEPYNGALQLDTTTRGPTRLGSSSIGAN